MTPMAHSEQPQPASADPAATLTGFGYLELFLRGDDRALDEVWGRPDSPEQLRRLALDTHAAPLPRFLAAEVLFARDATFPRPSEYGPLARLYVEALHRTMTGMANPWGLPGELDGPAATHLLALGNSTVSALAPLLDDEGDLRYSGSKEATVGNSYDYRVKDMAASLIAALLGVAYPVHLDPRDRDAEIDLLRQRLP